MHLISTLNAGLVAASNGWAEVYIRGTTTRATWYPNFEASTSNSSGDNIPLDAYGAAEVYVNQLVDVVAKSADGTIVRSWTDGYASGNIEVISPSFTGHDYVSGAAAVNEPTTLQAVLDLWETQAGAPDWSVSIGGTPTTMEDAFGALDGLVFNVKSPQFGAIGDGVANDQAAIQAAIFAAGASGGGVVFFPQGTYRTLTAIPLDNKVSLKGAGAGCSIISVDSATEHVFVLTSATVQANPFLIEGLVFASKQINPTSQVVISAVTGVNFRDCLFCYDSNSTGWGLEYTVASQIAVDNCTFNIWSSTTSAIIGPSSAQNAVVSLRGNTFIGPDTLNGPMVNLRNTVNSTVTGNYFNGGKNTTSGVSCYGLYVDNRNSVSNNFFEGSPFDAAIRYGAACIAVATGNTFYGCTTRYSVAALLSVGSFLELEGHYEVPSSATPSIPDGVAAADFRSSTTVPTWTMPTKLYPGQVLRLQVINFSGANWATPMVFPGVGSLSGVPSPNINNGASAAVEFIVCDLTGGTYTWRRRYTIG